MIVEWRMKTVDRRQKAERGFQVARYQTKDLKPET
jgi:hypothetical protein